MLFKSLELKIWVMLGCMTCFREFVLSAIIILTGTAFIMDDIDSDSTKLYTFLADDSASVKGLGTIESNNGFYIRAKKPMDSGEFSFLYGVYQKIDKPGNQLKEAKYSEYCGEFCHFDESCKTYNRGLFLEKQY